MNSGKTILDRAGVEPSSSQMNALARFSEKISRFGVNFGVCDINGELLFFSGPREVSSTRQRLIDAGRAVFGHTESGWLEDGSGVHSSGEDKGILAVVLRGCTEPLAAVVELADSGACDDANGTVEGDRGTIRMVLSEMLSLFEEHFYSSSRAGEQIDIISEELAQTYEELVLLHKLSTNMKVTEPDSNFLQMACDNLTDIVSVEGIAILLEKNVDEENKLVVAAGSGVIAINDEMAANLYDRLVAEVKTGKEALLDSEVDSPFRYNWPGDIKNMIAVPLFGKDKSVSGTVVKGSGNNIIGLMVAKNRLDKPDFDSTDVKLFNSVANGCAVFVENGRLFKDLKELFIGSLKALTNSIDAKDPYTRGHSERVAFISRWIAEKIDSEESLDQEQIQKIYLAGLLHDIGKMGIDEAILRKKEKLTDEEFGYIRKHPSIGAGILSGIKQMREIVPGVLYHHERADGKGYPNELSGVEIPLIGKIIALADSFDAMTSRRTYRKAMNIKEALEEIERGIGSQFDEKVARAFLGSDVYHLCNIIQNGFSEAYGTGDFSEYETLAVGTLVR